MMTEAQSEHLASIDWQRGKWADAKGKYSREHTLAPQIGKLQTPWVAIQVKGPIQLSGDTGTSKRRSRV
jgi:hypothetical protein